MIVQYRRTSLEAHMQMAIDKVNPPTAAVADGLDRIAEAVAASLAVVDALPLVLRFRARKALRRALRSGCEASMPNHAITAESLFSKERSAAA